MSAQNLQFLLPCTVTLEDFIAGLESSAEVRTLSRKQDGERTYYDSFDWRLFDADTALAIVRQDDSLLLRLSALESGSLVGEAKVADVPVFAADIEDEKLRKIVAEALEMRALLPMLTQSFSTCHYRLLNKRGKTVCLLSIETSETQIFIQLQALRGYGRALSKWAALLQQDFGLMPAAPVLLLEPLHEQQQRAGHYLHKLCFSLEPEMRADAAGRLILRRLLEVIRNNEEGVIENIDSEFLHDFRVAIRKTRSALGQLKGIFPEPEVQKFRDFFCWLGRVTGPTRDMDVYLLSFAGYQNSLPSAIQGDLEPLYVFLATKHRLVQAQLAQHLQSKPYTHGLAEWESFLLQVAGLEPNAFAPPNAAMPVRKFAKRRIWRIYRRALRQGNAIDNSSPPEDLHELRKTCKKLRYLMEFFQSLFPAEEIAAPIKTLKAFQEVLGNFQDYQVQEQHLKGFSEEMIAARVPAATFLAMGVLIQRLDDLRGAARADFAERFADFKSAGNQAAFVALFAPAE